jgi:hypothetical protein
MSIRDFLADGFSNTNPFDPCPGPDTCRLKVIVIQIYGDEVIRDRYGDPQPQTSTQINLERLGLLSWFQQVFAPLSTLLNVRQTSQYARNEDTYKQIENLARRQGGRQPYRL